ncbi:hypothetical protein ASALC70_03505 [Alcanivorax sp. ALC70]|nr:hypothetical protein ASALC70_03505 [Alcanivorax sp. ALC70]
MRLTLNEQGLTAITLLIAESDPNKAKDLTARLVINLIVDDIGVPTTTRRVLNKRRLLGTRAIPHTW